MNPWSLTPAAAAHGPLLQPLWPFSPQRNTAGSRVQSPAKRPAAAQVDSGSRRIDLQEAVRSLEDGSSEARRGLDGGGLYNSLIQVCISEKALPEGERLRAYIERVGYEPGVFLENQFLNLYAKCGEVRKARDLFDRMSERNAVTWNAMIAGYCSNQCFLEASLLFAAMVESGGQIPNQATYLAALRAAVGCRNLKLGLQVHGRLLKLSPLLSRVEVGNSVMNMYAKLGRPRDAWTMFDNMPERDAISWNTAIAASARSGSGSRALTLFLGMNAEGFHPDGFTFASFLGSEDVAGVAELHGQIIKRNLEDDSYVGSALLAAYASNGSPREALLVFDGLTDPNTIAWNSAIAACVENMMAEQGLRFFLEMHHAGVLPDACTISSLLGAATAGSFISVGKQAHGLAVKLDLCRETTVGNALITLYSKQGFVSDSRRSFQCTADPDLITWNSMAQAYLTNEKHKEALALFVEMKLAGVEGDQYGFTTALGACGSLCWKRTGTAIHGDAVKLGIEVDAFVGSALVDMYGKCAAVTEAELVFDGIERKDLVVWNSMAIAYAQNGCLDQALLLLSAMWEDGSEPDEFTFSGVLSACAEASALQSGRQLHALVTKSAINADTAVANALMTMYARSGCVTEASQIFSQLAAPNAASWTAMIGGYAQSGRPRKALKLFEQMAERGVRPDGKTFLALLTACSYAGEVDEAERFFEAMETEYGLRRELEHYACMVDVLGRAGRLEEAEGVINEMPHAPNALVWRTLLGACRTHGDLKRGEKAMEMILATQPGDSAAYVLLSNMYAARGRWDGVAEVRSLMREKGLRKEPGKSWIEVQHRVHEFVAGDSTHPQTDAIYSTLGSLLEVMRAAGDG